jgi:AraC family transcriptional regulator
MGIRLKAGQFYGSKSEALSANGYCYTESTYAPTAKLPIHTHELAHFCLVIEGSYVETIGRRTYDRVPTTLVYFPTNLSHSEKHRTNGRHFLIEIQPSALQRVTEFGSKLDDPISFDRLPINWLATRIYEEYRNPDEFSALVLESISTELLVAISRMNRIYEKRRPPKWLTIVKEFLRDIESVPTSLGEVAAVAGVHPTHLARVFRSFEQCTIGEFVRRSRIECVKAKILKTDDSLVQIAVDAGFSDQSHLTRSFRNVTGMTPSTFRSIFRSR